MSNTVIPTDLTLEKAKLGCETSTQILIGWIYTESLSYFVSKAYFESKLSVSEAEDSAGECVLEFRSVLPQVRMLERYARRMFRNNMIRYLSRKRARQSREILSSDRYRTTHQLEEVADQAPSEPKSISDRDALRVYTSLRQLNNSDPILKQVWAYRMADDPMGYKQIGEIMGMDDAALRMRIARFCRRVRKECRKNERRLFQNRAAVSY